MNDIDNASAEEAKDPLAGPTEGGGNPMTEPAAGDPGSNTPVQDPVRDPASITASKPHPRTGPIVWGALVLAFCIYVAQRTIAPAAVDTTTWIIAAMIGIGALLLVVGVAVLVRNARRR